MTALAVAAAITAGLAGGVYLTFTIMVLPALRSLPASEAIRTMRAINVSAVRLPFMSIFFGGAIAAAAVIISELASGSAAQFGPLRIAGAALALSAFIITIVRNVPLNNSLAQDATSTGDPQMQWRSFERSWGVANAMRAAASLAASALLVASL